MLYPLLRLLLLYRCAGNTYDSFHHEHDEGNLDDFLRSVPHTERHHLLLHQVLQDRLWRHLPGHLRPLRYFQCRSVHFVESSGWKYMQSALLRLLLLHCRSRNTYDPHQYQHDLGTAGTDAEWPTATAAGHCRELQQILPGESWG